MILTQTLRVPFPTLVVPVMLAASLMEAATMSKSTRADTSTRLFTSLAIFLALVSTAACKNELLRLALPTGA
jgi:hypothetical protein